MAIGGWLNILFLLLGLFSRGYKVLENACIYMPVNITFIHEKQIKTRLIIVRDVLVYANKGKRYCNTLIEVEPMFDLSQSRYGVNGLEVPAFSDVSGKLFYISKGAALPSWYVPKKLVKLHSIENNKTVYVRPEVYRAFLKLRAAAKEQGYVIYVNSGYRSYKTQKRLFEGYLKYSEKAHTYSAVAGSSQHQTGLVIDIGAIVDGKRIGYDDFRSEDSNMFRQWLHSNAHKFGFIQPYVSYTDNDHFLEQTGYILEPWHLYYVGPQLAHEFILSGLEFMDWIIYKLSEDERPVRISFKNFKE